jgi:anti-sigma-K factor RskA
VTPQEALVLNVDDITDQFIAGRHAMAISSNLRFSVIAGKAAPKSMGLMRDEGATALDRIALDIRQGMTLAVSVEPKGGSPTGLPTGPVIYSGQMIELPTS